jgi:BMFP domain-containing protein YqiC
MLLLAGCGGGEGWTKPGADAAAATRELDDCREVTAMATKVDANIDQDISASRGVDLQRLDIVRRENRETRETTRDRAAAILAACMQAKGFRQNAK